MNTRHWNWIQALALAALLPLFAACSSEGDELLQGEEKQMIGRGELAMKLHYQ